MTDHSSPGNAGLRHLAQRAIDGGIEIIDREFGFVRAVLPYDYRFTCNAQQWNEAERICQALEGPMISQGVVLAQAMPQQVQEACAQVADRAAERYAEGKVMPGDHIRHMLALGIARSIRSLIPPASQLPSTEGK